ncbi:cytochrome P450 [Tricladium varicosporioides]|nr:cytochrome P450 [Hymenoscyphus varicosporioides]
MLDFAATTETGLVTLLTFSVLVLLSQAVWRLVFSPIAGFPGPKLAALTYWYEFYYDIVLGGQYLFKMIELHKQYGPIIRINPHELHVADPEFFDTVYAGAGHKRDRDDWHTDGYGLNGSVVTSPRHELHKHRRAALAPFFSGTGIRKLVPLIEERISTMISRLTSFKDTGAPVNLLHAFSAFSNDVIVEYCFGQSEHRLEALAFDPSYYYTNKQSTVTIAFRTHLPLFPKLLLSLPTFIALHIPGGIDSMTKKGIYLKKQINQVKRQMSSTKAGIQNQTIFHALLEADLPASEKTDKRLVEEAILVVGAGSHTLAWTLTCTAFYILSSPSVLRNLKEELQSAKKDKKDGVDLTLPELEKLPYLTACIKEGLRLAYGVSVRMPRVAPDEVMKYKDWTIPAGTAVSVCSVIVHQNEDIFPDHRTFNPERWLGPNSRHLEKYLTSFGGGGRICLGMNLAWTEAYICIGRLFENFGGKFGCEEIRMEGDKGVLELWETDLSDIEIQADLFFPEPKEGSKGLRVNITN